MDKTHNNVRCPLVPCSQWAPLCPLGWVRPIIASIDVFIHATGKIKRRQVHTSVYKYMYIVHLTPILLGFLLMQFAQFYLI